MPFSPKGSCLASGYLPLRRDPLGGAGYPGFCLNLFRRLPIRDRISGSPEFLGRTVAYLRNRMQLQ
jgi:hypothetical protein